MVKINRKVVYTILMVLAIGICWLLSKTENYEVNKPFNENKKDIVLMDKRYRLKRDNAKSYNIEVHYPQIETLSVDCNVAQINAMIKDVAVAVLDNSFTEFVVNMEMGLKDLNRWEEDQVSYEILEYNSRYLSLIFNTLGYSGGAHPYEGSHLVTIDMEMGEYIHFDDLVDMDRLKDILTKGDFKVYDGTYSDLDEESVYAFDVICDLIQSMEKIKEDVVEGRKYYAFSSQNIGLNEEYLYVYLRSNIGFHGYFILQIPRELLSTDNWNITQNTDSNNEILKDEIYLLKRHEEMQKDISVKIDYPVISKTLYNETEKSINTILKNTAFALFGDTYEDAVAMFEKMEKDYNQWIKIEIEYDILQANENCISIIFSSDVCSDDMGSDTCKYMITINTETGQYIRLCDLVSTKQLKKILYNRDCKVYACNFREGLTGSDIYNLKSIAQFIQIFEKDSGLAKGDQNYDAYSSQNIGMDEEYLYIYFMTERYLKKYVIYQIPWKT